MTGLYKGYYMIEPCADIMASLAVESGKEKELPAYCNSERPNQETADLINDKTKRHNVKSSLEDIVQQKMECYRKTIIGNWKFLKENLNPDSILEELISQELFDSDDYDRVCGSSRSKKISFMLTYIVRSINNADDFNKLLHILETTKNGFLAEKLKILDSGPEGSNKIAAWIPKDEFNSIDLCKHLIEYNRNLIEKELKKPHLYADDFLQNFIIDIDEHEQFLMSNDTSRKAYAAKIVDIVLSKLEKESFQMLMCILKETCNSHVFEKIGKAFDETPKKSEKRFQVEVKITEEGSTRDIKEVGSSRFILQAGDESTEEFIRNNIGSCITKLASECGAYVTEIKYGSVIVHLKAITSSMKTEALEDWRTGEALKILMDGLFSNTDFLNNHSMGQFTIGVTIEIDNNGSEPEIKNENSQKQQRSLFKGNRNFLLEEIDPIDFLDVYSSKGFYDFDSLDLCHIPERKVRAEKFLNLMQAKPEIPEEVFLEILNEKKMNFILRRLELFRRIQWMDTKLLVQIIRDNISSLAEELYVDDMKEFFVQNGLFQENVFEELYSKYPDNSETRITMFIIKVLQAGESALYTFIDVLFNSDIDMSLLNLMFNDNTLQTVYEQNAHKEDITSGIINGLTCTQILLKGEITIKVEMKDCFLEEKIKNRLQDTVSSMESVEMVLSKMKSHIEVLQSKLDIQTRLLLEIESHDSVVKNTDNNAGTDDTLPVLDSTPLNHSIVRQLSRKEITDGKIQHIKEMHIIVDAGDKLSVVPFETKDDNSEKRYTTQMEGFLKKRISLVRGYKNVWFVLKWDGYLQYFLQKPERKDQNPTGQMLLLLSDTTVKTDGVSFKLVAANNKKYYLRASDKGKRDEWTKAINEVRTKLYNRMFKGIYDKPDHERCPTADDDAQNNMAFAEDCKLDETELTDETSCAKADIASLFTGRKKPFVAVAAIDFGTTYSGCAFSTVNAFKTNPLKIETIPLDDTNVFSNKTPTVLLLTPNGGFHSFGARAKSTYYTLAMKDEASSWYYFNRFKMQLYNNKELKSDMTLTELSGKTMKAVYVFAFCIEFIKDKVVKRLVKAIHGIQEDEIHWVLTVPAIWNDQARQFMIQAAQKAGIDTQNLSLALEPEGAAMCCKYLELEKKEQGGEIDLSSFNDNARFMVVDLGGGTIDITVYEVLSNGQLKEIYNATGGPWGGNSINAEIIKTLTENLRFSLIKDLVDEDLEDYLDLERDVEETKRTFKTKSDFKLRIPNMLQSNLVISNALKDTVKMQNGRLILSSSLMQKIFCTSVDKVIVHVRNLLAKKETHGVSTIHLVGGYAASEIVQKAFHDNFGEKLKIIFPLTPDMIVLKGAVIIGHMAKPIVSRIAKYHYGLALLSKAVSGNAISLGDNEKNTFFPLIAKGQQIKVGDIVTQYEIVLEARSTWANVEIYTTEEDKPRKRIDEEHFRKVGNINVKLPRFIKQSVLILTISYDETEFKVVATDKNTGRCFVGVCRFLEK